MLPYLPEIPIIDFEAEAAARGQFEATGLSGRLGPLEPLALRLAAITGQTAPTFPRKAAVVLAADHGHEMGDPAATEEAVLQTARGKAPINALARQAGVALTVVDIGLAEAVSAAGLERFPAGRGTRDWRLAPALVRPQVQDALLIGMNLVSVEMRRGLDVLALGEIAPGGRPAALAALHLLTGDSLDQVGATANEARLIQDGLARHAPAPDPMEILCTFGGLELAGLAGLVLAAGAGRIPVVLDGLISTVAALLASFMHPGVRPYLLAGQTSGKPAHNRALRRLNLRPLLDLGGQTEVTGGSILALHLVEAASRVLEEATPRTQTIGKAEDDGNG